MTTVMDSLSKLSSPALVELFNQLTGESVKRFASKGAGLKRIEKLLTDAKVAARLDALLGLKQTTVIVQEPIDDGSPIPEVNEDTLTDILDKTTDKPLKAKPKAKKAPKPAPDSDEVKAIKDREDLVAVRGRVVRPENAQRILKGEALWGGVGDQPKDKDRLKGENAAVNLNYPPKPGGPKPLREGTMRAKLVAAMKAGGVTVEDVMREFGIERGAAIYKLRDLHYVSGHGLQMKGGRIFLNDNED